MFNGINTPNDSSSKNPVQFKITNNNNRIWKLISFLLNPLKKITNPEAFVPPIKITGIFSKDINRRTMPHQ